MKVMFMGIMLFHFDRNRCLLGSRGFSTKKDRSVLGQVVKEKEEIKLFFHIGKLDEEWNITLVAPMPKKEKD